MPRQSSMSSRSRWKGVTSLRQRASTAVRSGPVIEYSRQARVISATAASCRPLVDSASASRSDAGAGLRRLGAEEGEDLLRRHARGHLPLAGAAQRLQPGPVGMRGDEGDVLVPVAGAVAQPGPGDDVDGDSAAGPRGAGLGLEPVAGGGRVERPGQQGALGRVCPAAGTAAPSSRLHSSTGNILERKVMLVPRSACSVLAALYHSVCRPSAPAALAVNSDHD